MLKIPSEFEQKLKEKGTYEKFITNVNEYDRIYRKYFPNGRIINENSFCEYIGSAFVWEATPEGYDYWIDIATMEEIQ